MSGLLFIDLNVRTFRPLTSFPNDKNDNLLLTNPKSIIKAEDNRDVNSLRNNIAYSSDVS